MIKDLQYAELPKENYLLIDVRSESEYLEATIPGAINVPIFNDEERAKVGTIYKHHGTKEAENLGIEIVSPKIPSIIKQINNSLNNGQLPIFFCWRGGMRSKTMATLFSLINQEVYRLEGGYRAYREYILDQIANTQIKIPTFVLHGMTGVGKTSLLQKIEASEIKVIDLEKLAGHRGSIFGGIGDINPVNQKQFDALVYEELKGINNYQALIIEAESKRIGKVFVSENILKAKENGIHVMITASLNKRIERIVEEYQPQANKAEIDDAVRRLAGRLPTETRGTLFTALEESNYSKVVEILLIYYYDPRYQHSTEQYSGSFHKIASDDLAQAVQELIAYIRTTLSKLSVHS